MTARVVEVRPRVQLNLGGPAVAALLAACGLPLAFNYFPDGAVVFGLWGGLLFALGWWLCGLAPAASVSRCRALFATAFVIRVVMVVLLVHFDFWQDDELLYHDRAQLVAVADVLRQPWELWDLGSLRYAVICQLLYGVLGYDSLGPRLLNAWFGSLIGVAIYLIAARHEDRPWAVHAGWLVALFPDLVLYSGFELKDIGIALGLTVFLLGLTKRAPGTTPLGQWTLLLLGAVLACFLRFFLLAPMAMGLCWKLLERGGRGLARRALIAAAVFVLVDLTMLLVSSELSVLQRLLQAMSEVHVSMFGIAGDDDRSFFNAFGSGYTPLSVVIGFAYVFLVPFIVWPFTLSGAIYQLLAPGIFLWYAALPFVARGGFHLAEKASSTIFAVTAMVLMALALGGGFHATGRHRVMIMPVLLMYAARGFDDFRRRDLWARRIVFGYAAALVLGLAYYSIVKGL